MRPPASHRRKEFQHPRPTRDAVLVFARPRPAPWLFVPFDHLSTAPHSPLQPGRTNISATKSHVSQPTWPLMPLRTRLTVSWDPRSTYEHTWCQNDCSRLTAFGLEQIEHL